MNAPNDGGPAFPVTLFEGQTLGDGSANGMSLRDWFAGQALASMNYEWFESARRTKEMSNEAYGIADAMLAARGAK